MFRRTCSIFKWSTEDKSRNAISGQGLQVLFVSDVVLYQRWAVTDRYCLYYGASTSHLHLHCQKWDHHRSLLDMVQSWCSWKQCGIGITFQDNEANNFLLVFLSWTSKWATGAKLVQNLLPLIPRWHITLKNVFGLKSKRCSWWEPPWWEPEKKQSNTETNHKEGRKLIAKADKVAPSS